MAIKWLRVCVSDLRFDTKDFKPSTDLNLHLSSECILWVQCTDPVRSQLKHFCPHVKVMTFLLHASGAFASRFVKILNSLETKLVPMPIASLTSSVDFGSDGVLRIEQQSVVVNDCGVDSRGAKHSLLEMGQRESLVVGFAVASVCTSVFCRLYWRCQVARWRNGLSVGLANNRLRVQILLKAPLCNNLGQVVHTCVPLSPSSVTWYRPNGGDALWLGK